MKKEEKPSRYGINGAVMDNPDMSDELRADYEGQGSATDRRSGVWPISAALLFAVGILFFGLGSAQAGIWGISASPSTYIIIGSLAICAASFLRWRWQKKAG